jgi:hypothetical protein
VPRWHSGHLIKTQPVLNASRSPISSYLPQTKQTANVLHLTLLPGG